MASSPPAEAPIDRPLEGDDPRSELIQQLLDYKKYKDAARALEERAAEWYGAKKRRVKLIGVVSGFCQESLPKGMKFGHAGAKEGMKGEGSARSKSDALKKSGAIVPPTFGALGPAIKDIYQELLKSGQVKELVEPAVLPRLPKSIEEAMKADEVMVAPLIRTTISDDRGDEPCYDGYPASELINKGYEIPHIIGLLWDKRLISKQEAEVIKRIIMLSADHGPCVSGALGTIIAACAGIGMSQAVAAGLAPLALGSDTGGSIRQPAALCGVVGLKPTYGRVSRSGIIAFASSLDQIGPFATTVDDAALLLEAIAGPDPRDSTSIPEPFPRLTEHLDRGVEGLRVGLITELTETEGIEVEVSERVREAAAALEKAGAHVEEVSVPSVIYGLTAYYLINPAEASSNLARYDGVRYGLRVDGPDVNAMYGATRAAGFGAEVKRRIMLGTYALSSGYIDAYYLKALKVRRLIKNDFDRAFADCDVIMGPTSPTAAFKIGEKTNDPLAMYLSDIYTISGNLAGLTGVSIPCGFTTRSNAPRDSGDVISNPPSASVNAGTTAPSTFAPATGRPSTSCTLPAITSAGESAGGFAPRTNDPGRDPTRRTRLDRLGRGGRGRADRVPAARPPGLG